ncbi:hypothetical protein F5883DRAFT_560031 [Diaporthe sp. PMI_573]|nr:hypothetical protein F5883DRAFT_560031 [Diaporthaceae sp. PMI_573]
MDPLEQQPRPQAYWPRRLLHIPTMRSVERSEGNGYGPTGETSGKVVEPPFATLCYTWGRYRSFADEGSDIAISGLPPSWGIPSVDPRHFTTDALRQVIQTISRDVGVDYMWIDIACVNTDWDPDVDFEEEVYMQQYIFMTASWSFIWLSETASYYVSEVAKNIQDIIVDPASSHMKALRTTSSLSAIFADPWFSGMWTLLEGARRLDAIIISSDGHSSVLCDQASTWRDKEWSKPTKVMFEKHDSINLQKTSMSSLSSSDSTPPLATRLLSLRDIIYVTRVALSSSPPCMPSEAFERAVINSGLVSFEPFSLLSLYDTAQRRMSDNPSFRWRYINDQIFGFPRISMSVSGAEVEKQFATNLLLYDPVLSQLFMRQSTADTGRAWYLTTNCKPLPMDFFAKHFDSFKYLFRIRTSPGAQATATTVYFEGPTKLSRDLKSGWLHSPSTSGLLALSFDHCMLQVADSIREIPSTILFPTGTEQGYVVSKSTMRRHFLQFLELSGDLETRVLAMATGSRADRASGLVIGLIIARQKAGSLQDHWKRVGVCVWSAEFEEINNIKQTYMRVPGTEPQDGSWEVLSGLRAG